MRDYYEALGIARDASPADIRRAYKKLISSAHPDKGGSDGQAQEINAAYETLMSPHRRLHYDRTGQDRPPDLNQAATNLLAGKVTAWANSEMSSGNMIDEIDYAFSCEISSHKQNIQVGKEKVRRIKKLLARLKFKGIGNDRIKPTVEFQLNGLLQQIEQITQQLQVTELARIMAKEYEFEADAAATRGCQSYFIR